MRRKQGENLNDVISILRRHGRPMAAYEVLHELREANPKSSPPTVYRALATLTARGDVHRLESLNAFMACRGTHHVQPAVMCICDDCGHVEESIAPKLLDEVASVAGSSGFTPSRHVIEVHGTCVKCGAAEAP